MQLNEEKGFEIILDWRSLQHTVVRGALPDLHERGHQPHHLWNDQRRLPPRHPTRVPLPVRLWQHRAGGG